MRITLYLSAKTDREYIRQGMRLYEERISRYSPFEVVILPDVKKKLPEKEHKAEEGRLLLRALKPSDKLILFDEKGTQLSSPAFASFIQKFMLSGIKHLAFAVGGPYGFSGEVLDRADNKLSLSEMTFPHQLVRLIILEQFYRAFTILKGEPYHHG